MRILITRLSALGDCVHTLPLLCAARRAFPDAHIAWAVHPGPANLIRDHVDLDEVIVAPRSWLSSPQAVWSLRDTLLAREFDVALDPQSLTKSSSVAWLSGAPRRIGFGGPQGRELSGWLNNELVLPSRLHMVERYLELLRPLGIGDGEVEFKLPTWPAAADRIEDFIASAHLGGGFAVLNPGAGWESKRWPPERFGRLARTLGAERGLVSVVAWAGSAEESLAADVVSHSGGHALPAPATDLHELTELLRRARVLVAGDTGPLHIAAAVGAPCVGLYGPTDGAICGPFGPEHAILQATMSGEGRFSESAEAMRALDVADVAAACERLLGDAPLRKAS